MKAFRIDWADRRLARVLELDYTYELPRVECRVCEPEWGSWGSLFEFPALQFDFLNRAEFSYDRVVTLEQFRRIKRRIERAAGRSINLIPGSALGQLEGVALTAKLADFVWGTICNPQISKRARDLLAEEGVDLVTAECNIRCRGRRIDSHLAIQAEPVALLTEEGLKRLGTRRCERCGNYVQPPPPFVRHGYLLQKSAWPKGQHLVTVEETLDVLASPQFMEAVRKHGLVDIKFEECGRFVE